MIILEKSLKKNNGKLLGSIYDAEDYEHLYKYSIQIKNKI